MTTRTSKLFAALVALLATAAQAQTAPFSAGPNYDGSSYLSSYVLSGPSQPVSISYDANAGPWLKTFAVPEGPPINGGQGIGFVTESIAAAEAGWTGWYEEILTPGWAFAIDDMVNMATLMIGFQTAPGLQIEHTDTTLLFTFDAITEAGANLLPNVGITCTVFFETDPMGMQLPSGKCGSEVLIAQYPIMGSQHQAPEPSTLGLLGLALLALGWSGRRRARAN